MNIAGVILAAGNSRRFKGIKQLALVHDKPMLNHVTGKFAVHGVLMPQLHSLTVILGSQAEQIRPLLPDYVQCKICDNWQQGMGVSLAFAVRNVNQDVSHLLVVLADQVDVNPELISQLIDQCHQSPDKIITAKYADICGPPVIFPRHFFGQLAKLEGDQGARSLLNVHWQQVKAIDMPQARTDIDSQADLQAWLATQPPE